MKCLCPGKDIIHSRVILFTKLFTFFASTLGKPCWSAIREAIAVFSVALLFIARSAIYLIISFCYTPLVSTSIIMFLRGRLNVCCMYIFCSCFTSKICNLSFLLYWTFLSCLSFQPLNNLLWNLHFLFLSHLLWHLYFLR